MKKIKLMGLIGCLVLSIFMVTGCGNKEVEGDLATLMDKVYASVAEDERPMMLENFEVTDENIESYLGTKVDYKEALASGTMVGSIPHSVVLVRLNDDANVKEEVEKIKKNADPRKWVCVEAEEVKVLNKGKLVILIMTDKNTAENIEKEFNNL